MPEPVDPFEAFRKKKDAAKEAERKQKAQEIKPVIPPEALEGRPKGFASHRFGFGRKEEEAQPGARPKGFVPTEVGDGPKPIEPLPKPKGFNTARLVKRKKS